MIQISYSTGGVLAVIEFDATISATHLAGSDVTEHSVEAGVNVTDHIRPRVDRLTLDCFVTNSPIRVPKTNLGGATGGVGPLDLEVPTTTELPISVPGVGAALKGAGLLNGTSVVKATVLQFNGDFDRVGEVYHELKTLQETATLLTVVTDLREYEDMVIEELTVPREVGDGDAAHFQLGLKHIRFATAKVVPAPKIAAKKVNRGVQPPTLVSEDEKKSILAKLSDSFFK